jgi:hypothetical protein
VASYSNGQWVKLLVPSIGTMEGPSAQHGAGDFREVPKGSLGEIIDIDATTGWIDVIFPHDFGGPHSPYHTRAVLDPDLLESAQRPASHNIELPEPPEDAPGRGGQTGAP